MKSVPISLLPGGGKAATNKPAGKKPAAKKPAGAADPLPKQAPAPTPPPLPPPPQAPAPAMIAPPSMRPPPSLVSAPGVQSPPAFRQTQVAPPPAPVTAIPPVQVLGETTQNAAMDAKRRQQGQGFNYSKTLMRKGRGAQ